MATTMDLRIDLQPITAHGSTEPFAWHAGIHARPQAFHGVDAILLREDRAELEALRLDRAFAAAADAGLVAAGALLVVPVQVRAGTPDRLLAHLFRAALRHRFPIENVVVEISADEATDRDAAAAMIHACTDRGMMIALGEFAAGPLGLGLLAHCSPRLIRLAGALAHRLDVAPARARLIEGVLRLANGMGVTVTAPVPTDEMAQRAALEAGLRHFEGKRDFAPRARRYTRPARPWGAPVMPHRIAA
ncbi:EAL domain-containing protein [Sphingomonas sp. TDK1]|uniref:EAL domain-containing protein n=1 Tax=Sphingomonas sp. TDK1 TaxID=453247 RepID=UPI0007D8F293|nr:EAL domain-containing protein [Sphingomonas sp. TDK1]OAN66066.1 diguanylate phosphodiesterase [Sphingomonas sp. TDK1]